MTVLRFTTMTHSTISRTEGQAWCRRICPSCLVSLGRHWTGAIAGSNILRTLVVSVVLLSFASGSSASPDQTVVLANRNVPESLELAGHYLKARNIPDQHLLVLDLPDAEQITREIYEERLRGPLLQWLETHDWIQWEEGSSAPTNGIHLVKSSRLKYLVSIYGVPLRIANGGLAISDKIEQAVKKVQKDTAAVDSELALLLHPVESAAGMNVNPVFRAELWPPSQAKPRNTVVIAARLDGPSPAVVRKMIDDAVAIEAYGLLGRAYFDLRNITERGYVLGEIWMQEAYHRFLREGYECVINRDPGLWHESYPMEDAAFYLGWYAEHAVGPFARDGLRCSPGAIAYHLHSGSAATLRSDSKHWVGPLLARGAAASMGTVHEPYLIYTPQLDVFTHRLCNGLTFGEAAYLASSVLSWQTTVVGDPLYRPFATSLDQQIQKLEQDQRPEVEWAYLRKVNTLARRGQLNLAFDYCRKKIKQTQSLLLREKMADLYAVNQMYEFAAEEYRIVINTTSSEATAIRTGGRLVWLLQALQRNEDAEEVRRQVRETYGNSPLLPWFDKIGAAAPAATP